MSVLERGTGNVRQGMKKYPLDFATRKSSTTLAKTVPDGDLE